MVFVSSSKLGVVVSIRRSPTVCQRECYDTVGRAITCCYDLHYFIASSRYT